jgi:hypothetical protein
MDNQHRSIKGYRDLSQTEIDLMNAIKNHGEATEALIQEVREHLNAQRSHDPDELKRITNAEPARWLSIARTHLQEGTMALVRSVAQPSSF